MKRFIFVIFAAVMFVLLISACEQADNSVSSMHQENADDLASKSLTKVGRTMVWADCNVYASVVTPATFYQTAT